MLMSGRKGTVIWVCTVVILAVLTLSGGLGTGVSTAADSTDVQVVEATLEEGDGVIDTKDAETGPNEMRTVEPIEPFAAGTHDFSVTNVSIATLIGLDPGSPGQVSDSDEDDEEDEEEDEEAFVSNYEKLHPLEVPRALTEVCYSRVCVCCI
jgi:hypothetical protein